MTKGTNTKRSLVMSILVLVLCCSLLIGGTFAWFTDSAATGSNKIQAGTLEVDLLMANPATGEYTSIAGVDAAIFGASSLVAQNDPTATLWEPGKTQIAYLAVDNKDSNLDLKYTIQLDVEDGGLIGALEYAIVDGAKYGDLTAASWAEVKANAQSGDVPAGTIVAAPNGAIKADEGLEYFALAIHMKESAGSEYQGKSITVDVAVLATQLSSEADSFGNTYDAETGDFYAIDAAAGKYMATSENGLSAAAKLASTDASITSVTYVTADGAVEAPIVRDTAALQAAINAKEAVIVVTEGDFLGVELQNIEARESLTIVGAGAGTTLQFTKNNVTPSKFDALTISSCTIVKRQEKWGLLVFSSSAPANGVYTVSNCIFNSDGDQCIYINQSIDATFNIENCTFNAADSSHDGIITIQNNAADYTVNVSDCTFNTNNREIYVAYAGGGQTALYEGWTLNAPGVPVYTWAD